MVFSQINKLRPLFTDIFSTTANEKGIYSFVILWLMYRVIHQSPAVNFFLNCQICQISLNIGAKFSISTTTTKNLLTAKSLPTTKSSVDLMKICLNLTFYGSSLFYFRNVNVNISADIG